MRVADCDSWVTHTHMSTRAHGLMPSQAYLGVTLVTSGASGVWANRGSEWDSVAGRMFHAFNNSFQQLIYDWLIGPLEL